MKYIVPTESKKERTIKTVPLSEKISCAVQCEQRNRCAGETCRTYIKVGAKLRDVKFNNLWCKGLSIFDGDKCVADGFIGEVLEKVIHLADRKIKSCNYYFDMFVIRLEPEGEN